MVEARDAQRHGVTALVGLLIQIGTVSEQLLHDSRMKRQ
jgi:hypothetical protein